MHNVNRHVKEMKMKKGWKWNLELVLMQGNDKLQREVHVTLKWKSCREDNWNPTKIMEMQEHWIKLGYTRIERDYNTRNKYYKRTTTYCNEMGEENAKT